jgi:hypothetical protein
VVEAVEGDLAAAADTAAVDRLMVVAEAADLAAAAMAHHVEAVTAVDTVREEDRDTTLHPYLIGEEQGRPKLKLEQSQQGQVTFSSGFGCIIITVRLIARQNHSLAWFRVKGLGVIWCHTRNRIVIISTWNTVFLSIVKGKKAGIICPSSSRSW